MKRYLIFAWSTKLNENGGGRPFLESCRGGFNDYVGGFNEHTEFEAFVSKLKKLSKVHVIDMTFPRYAILPCTGGIYHNYEIDDTDDLYADYLENRLTEHTLFTR